MFKAFRNHLANWAEAYLWAPLGLLLIPGAAMLAYFITGRGTQENLDWLVDLAGRVFTVLVTVVLISITREASSFWLTKEEAKDQPVLYIVQTISKLFLFWLILTKLTS